jgi:thioredoxin reductase (NADPH)
VLVVVDEDAGALGEAEAELRDRYARQLVVCLRCPAEALARLEGFAACGEPVAIVLAGYELAGMSGTELVVSARRLHPQARRGLLMPSGHLGDRAS